MAEIIGDDDIYVEVTAVIQVKGEVVNDLCCTFEKVYETAGVSFAVWQFPEPDLHHQPPAGRLDYNSLDPQGGGKMFLVVGDTYN